MKVKFVLLFLMISIFLYGCSSKAEVEAYKINHSASFKFKDISELKKHMEKINTVLDKNNVSYDNYTDDTEYENMKPIYVEHHSDGITGWKVYFGYYYIESVFSVEKKADCEKIKKELSGLSKNSYSLICKYNKLDNYVILGLFE